MMHNRVIYMGLCMCMGGSSSERRGVALFIWIGSLRFTSWQHLRSYQDERRLVAVHSHDGFTVLPHC